MTLQQKQSVFAQNVARLIIHVDGIGLTCSLGEVFRSKEQAEIYAKEGKGIIDSLHCKKLAIDLHLFSPHGIYLTDFKSYEPLGQYWESLHQFNRWGGYFKSKYGGSRVDSVHFEMQDL